MIHAAGICSPGPDQRPGHRAELVEELRCESGPDPDGEARTIDPHRKPHSPASGT